MARQRVLERAGWTFWRCFAASFVARHASITADLFATLERMRITPVVGDVLESSSLVASRVVDPLAEAAEAADSAAEALTAA
jgi:hypothetical protein